MDIDVATILRKSELAHAEDACTVISEGWRVNVWPSLIKCRELHRIYTIRHKHLVSFSGEHAKQLAASVSVFLLNLESSIKLNGHWANIRGTATHHYNVFVLPDSQVALGCLRLIGKQDVSDADWDHIWNAKA